MTNEEFTKIKQVIYKQLSISSIFKDDELFKRIIHKLQHNDRIRIKFAELIETIISEEGPELLKLISSSFVKQTNIWKSVEEFIYGVKNA